MHVSSFYWFCRRRRTLLWLEKERNEIEWMIFKRICAMILWLKKRKKMIVSRASAPWFYGLKRKRKYDGFKHSCAMVYG
eukprot:UN10189